MRLVLAIAFTLLVPRLAAATGHSGGGGGGGGTSSSGGCGGGSTSADDTCLAWVLADGGVDAGDGGDGGAGDGGSDAGGGADLGAHAGMICTARLQPVGCSTGSRPIGATWLPIGFALAALLVSSRRKRHA